MGILITEMTADASVGGSELIPVSDAGTPKSMTPANIAAYTVDQIEAIAAGSAVTGADGVYVLQGGALKPVDIDLVCQHAIDTVWGKAAEASPANGDKLALKDDGDVEKTVTLAVLAEYVRATVQAAILDVSDLSDGSGTIATSDYLLVTQGTTGKRIQISDISTLIYASLLTYTSALSAVVTPADADIFYVVQGGVSKKVTLAVLKGVLGTCIAPATTTENYVPQWTSTQKTLKDGLSVQSTLRADGVAVNTALPTEKAVRDALLSQYTTLSAALGALAYGWIWVPAKDMTPSATAGAGTETKEYGTNDMTHYVLLFDGSAADESAEFDLVLPPEWDLGTLTFKAYWATGSADANPGELIKLSMAAGKRVDDDALDAALGTAQAVTDAVIEDDEMQVTAASPALTVAGTLTAGAMVHFKITRDYDYDNEAAGTAMDVDLRLFGVLIQYSR